MFQWFWQNFTVNDYHKAASSYASRLEVHAGFFRLWCLTKIDFLISKVCQNSRPYGSQIIIWFQNIYKFFRWTFKKIIFKL